MQFAPDSTTLYQDFQRYYERFIETATTILSEEEIARAKEEFFDLSGRVTETDQSMELRYSWFVEYLVFEYQYNYKTPAICLLEEYQRFSELERSIYNEFLNYKKGIFLIRGYEEGLISALNLADDKIIPVYTTSEAEVFEKNSIFQGNVFRYQGSYFFSPAVLVHPGYVSSLIVKTFRKKIKGDDVRFREFFWMLARLKLKQERFPRIPPVEIYKQVLGNESSWIFKTI